MTPLNDCNVEEKDCKVVKTYNLKLVTHPKSYNEELLLNLRELDIEPGDILEIYHPDSRTYQTRKAYPRLLLKVPNTDSSAVQKDSISVEQSIASQFGLQTYQYVSCKKVEPEKVSLQLLELTFKDQYLNRSDMWRLTQSLMSSVVYKNKTVEFCSQIVRCQVYEMWSQGCRVACGYVSDETKVVYRSSTSRFYLFIQMSSEMWEFDHFGDLYFEKAVSGFLTELFYKWKQMNTNHEVTIVLFSRSFYPTATSIKQFPPDMRACIQQDHLGRFFQDFYRVAVQNERHDDWSCVLRTLRQLFYHYPRAVLGRETIDGETLPDVRSTHAARVSAREAQQKAAQTTADDPAGAPASSSSTTSGSSNKNDVKVSPQPPQPPRAELSTADQGNFLEVLNMSLNVFEKHYQDRSLERTGQMSVVVTPGVGVFHVDRALTNITKQRIVDNGVGSDLVCLGEQPLHAVPLLKFHRRRGGRAVDDYSMPGSWINLSFYSSNKRHHRAATAYTSVPRIKVHEHCIPSFFPPTRKRELDIKFGEHRPASSRQNVANLLDPLHPAPLLTSPADIAVDHATGAELLKLKWGLRQQSRGGCRTPSSQHLLWWQVRSRRGRGARQRGAATAPAADGPPVTAATAAAAPGPTAAAADAQSTDLDAEFEAYDDQIFKLPNKSYSHEYRSFRGSGGGIVSAVNTITTIGGSTARKKSSQSFSEHSVYDHPFMPRQLSDPDLRRADPHVGSSSVSSGAGLRSMAMTAAATSASALSGGSPVMLPMSVTGGSTTKVTGTPQQQQQQSSGSVLPNKLQSHSFGALNLEVNDQTLGPKTFPAINNSPSICELSSDQRLGRAGQPLINPFDPKYTTIKLTSYRRRWVHIFPKNVSGALIQQHHKEDDALKKDLTTYPSSSEVEVDGLEDLEEENTQDTANLMTRVADNLEMAGAGGATVAAAGGEASGSLSRPPSLLNATSGTHKHRGSIIQSPLDRNTDHDTLLWGATGEQEWSAAITTGVDWKSLTLPACLPVTTDFFPSEETVDRDYVLNNYSLLPDDINEAPANPARRGTQGLNQSDSSQHSTYGRAPMTTLQVFNELVSQRLSQGFQLILPKDDDGRPGHRAKRLRKKKKSITPTGTGGASITDLSGGSSGATSTTDLRTLASSSNRGAGSRSASITLATAPTGSSVARLHSSNSISLLEPKPQESSAAGKGASEQPSVREFKLSIGTLFHKLKLVGQNRIEASVYRPRIVPDTLKKDYRYRFCAPYMTSYEPSTTKFKTERLDRYKWNYLDNYVSLYSDSYENPLIEDLKYWRVRIVVVPDVHRGVMKSLMERWREFPDAAVYPALTVHQQHTTVEGFLKLLEIIHRIKRPVIKKARSAAPGAGGTGGTAAAAAAAAGGVGVGGGSNVGGTGGGGGTASGGGGAWDRSTANIKITETTEVTGQQSRAANNDIPSAATDNTSIPISSSISSASNIPSSQQQQQQGEDKRPLTASSPLTAIASAMRSSSHGLNFFSPPHPGLPHYCFLSADAVQWLREHVQGLACHQDAMALLQALCTQGFIRHASGKKLMPVYYGFYIYFMVTGNKEQDTTSSPDTYTQEFHEVEIQPVDGADVAPSTACTPSTPSDGAEFNVFPTQPRPTAATTATTSQPLPGFLQKQLPPLQQPFRTSAGRLLSQGPVSIDINNRSERSEWGDLVCSASYSTDTAYLFCLRWMCATGALVAEQISMWQRRAASCNLFLFPIPSDPFALPHSLDCDPLRGPLHLPLIMSCNPPCSDLGDGDSPADTVTQPTTGTTTTTPTSETAPTTTTTESQPTTSTTSTIGSAPTVPTDSLSPSLNPPATINTTDSLPTAADAPPLSRNTVASGPGTASAKGLPSATIYSNPTGLCLKHDIFAQFPLETRPHRTRLLQEAILSRFGFVRFFNELSSTGSGAGGNDPNQFVHVTGNVFVMVLTPGMADVFPAQHYHQHQYPTAGLSTPPTGGSTPHPPPQGSHAAPLLLPSSNRHDTFHPTPRPTSLFPESAYDSGSSCVGSGVASPHEEYFHRLMADHHHHHHNSSAGRGAPLAGAGASTTSASAVPGGGDKGKGVSLPHKGKDRNRTVFQRSPGFLWSFNYMLTRRWKSVASGEEAFAELLLHDFRNFCANKNDRLRKFCESFLAVHEAAGGTGSVDCTATGAETSAEVVADAATGSSNSAAATAAAESTAADGKNSGAGAAAADAADATS